MSGDYSNDPNISSKIEPENTNQVSTVSERVFSYWNLDKTKTEILPQFLNFYNLLQAEYENIVKPVMFKNLIGRGHPEFSGKQQQDAQVGDPT